MALCVRVGLTRGTIHLPPFSPPLACIFGMPRLYFTCIPPVSHGILGIPCIHSISISIHFAADPQYPAVSSCIRTYLAKSSCIPLYLTVSHRLENGIWPKIHSRGGLRSLRHTESTQNISRRRRWRRHSYATPLCEITAAEAANDRRTMHVAGRNGKRTTGGRGSDPHRGPRKAERRRTRKRPTQRTAGTTQETHRHPRPHYTIRFLRLLAHSQGGAPQA